MWETGEKGISGTGTFLNGPPSPNTTLDTPIDLGYIVSGQVKMADLMSTTEGPMCYLYSRTSTYPESLRRHLSPPLPLFYITDSPTNIIDLELAYKPNGYCIFWDLSRLHYFCHAITDHRYLSPLKISEVT
ncbi:uncharacterized protein SETTUDRAFT_18376 [Exserohilum turcica Et28A]|uniref:Uncharacterized protein n=1 Tax=Exserohilum turcicum (strain 28A) TaxID=671987 RepID=R0J4R3_EXST2|nr:uncharacterized protein SETTUDRAFT_18376 [Exserohilum turcica Et28A]EOA91706.1 hypothetical protein SETTUDRAFT_18376 [Exserohilum turcica Et28A]